MQTQFEEYEDQTGLRFAFNVLPRSKEQEKKCTIKQSCLYQPLRPKESLLTLNSYPIACSTCHGIINPFCVLDSNHSNWSCPFCQSRNMISANLANDLQYVLDPSSMDIEYILPSENKNSGIFMFVIDLGVDEDELEALKDGILSAIQLLPQDSLVGLITFGKNVNIYEISHVEHFKSYSFNGAKSYTKVDVAQKLMLFPNKQDKRVVNNKLVQKIEVYNYNLVQFVQSLKPDGFKPEKYHRKAKGTGTALSIATHLLTNLFPKTGGRVMLFSGGPPTIGEGSIVLTPLKDSLRSHSDLKNDSKASKRFKKARQFYDDLAKSGSLNGLTFDIFVGSYDQVGLSEMECLVNKTGGVIVQSDSFTSAIFKQSLQRFLSLNEYGQSQFGLNGILEVKTYGLKLNGLIGHAMTFEQAKNSNDSLFYNDKNTVGLGGTNCWKLGALSNHSTYSLYYELDGEQANGPYALLQFITSYQHPDGSKRVHVTTSQRMYTENASDMSNIINYFDQEAATVCIAREAVFTIMNDPTIDVIRKYCDKILIETITTFGTYQKSVPTSVSIPFSMNLLPQFIYYLRRSNFLQIFNSSPDETSFYRHCFLMEDCTNALIMIQPSLVSYELEKEPEPVLLDSTSIQPNRILLLDTFFHILIYYGSVIAEWRREGYADQEEYGYLREFFDQPRQEAADILVDRFPLPRFIDTEEGGSQARFLMSKLNPATSYKNLATMTTSEGAVVLTDDVSLQALMEFVYKAVTSTT